MSESAGVSLGQIGDQSPEEQGIPSFSAFDLLSMSSVKSTTVGSVGGGCPLIGGRVRDMCVLYQAVPTRIALRSESENVMFEG
jgi:hypothetical protein